MEMKERVLCAAIWYKDMPKANILPKNITEGVVVCGHRHGHCIATFVALTEKRSVTPEAGQYTQGFLTNTGRFVDRKEALRIAIEVNQIINMSDTNGTELFSEDLY